MLITAGVENVLYSTNHPTSALILDNNFLRVIKRVTVSGITELVCEHVYLAGQGYRPVHPGILKKKLPVTCNDVPNIALTVAVKKHCCSH